MPAYGKNGDKNCAGNCFFFLQVIHKVGDTFPPSLHRSIAPSAFLSLLSMNVNMVAIVWTKKRKYMEEKHLLLFAEETQEQLGTIFTFKTFYYNLGQLVLHVFFH